MIRSDNLAEPYQVSFSNGVYTANADVPKEKGGAGCGFGPHELLEAALATCITMTVQMAARKHNVPLEQTTTTVSIDRSLPAEVAMTYALELTGPLTAEQRAHLEEAAANCPVSRTLTGKLVLERIRHERP